MQINPTNADNIKLSDGTSVESAIKALGNYRIEQTTKTYTTNANGNAQVVATDIPNCLSIISSELKAPIDAYAIPYKSSSGYWLRTKQWNDTVISNTSCTYVITYIVANS